MYTTDGCSNDDFQYSGATRRGVFCWCKDNRLCFCVPGLKSYSLACSADFKRPCHAYMLPRASGRASASFEMEDSPIHENILTGLGFSFGLALMLRLFKCATRLQTNVSRVKAVSAETRIARTMLSQAGMQWNAPVCSSWVWVSRSELETISQIN